MGTSSARDAGGDLGGEGVAVVDAHEAVVSDFAEHGGVEAPLVEYGAGLFLLALLHDHEHALLGFGEHDLIGVHAALAPGNVGQVDLDAGACVGRTLDGGGGEAGSAEVLHTDDHAQVEHFEAGLHEALFEEGVAHLHGGAVFEGVFAEGVGGEGGAVHAVTPGVGADEEDGVAHPFCEGEHDAVGADEAHAHGVDEGVAGVGVVEVDLAADRGHADAIAVAADARHDAAEEVAVVGIGEGAEAQGIEQSDGARTHSEDVANDAANACGSALYRLDGGGVVVGFDLEGDSPAVANVDHARVFAGTLEDAWSFRGEPAEEGLRMLVAAVLTPHRACHA